MLVVVVVVVTFPFVIFVTEDSVDTFRLFDNDHRSFCNVFHCTVAMITRFVIQLGIFAATNCVPFDFPVVKQMRLFVSIPKQFIFWVTDEH